MTSPSPADAAVLEARNFTVKYAGKPAVKSVSLAMPAHKITALIGPSGCGKSTLLRAFNRMNDFIPVASHEGLALFHGQDVHSKDLDPVDLRRRIGMVFQRPNPFPRSILHNVTWGPKINGYQGNLDELAEKALRQAALWDEVSSRLHESALGLSGGQQQRLCIARAIAMEPEVILLDEPCSALDPISTARIEELLTELKKTYTLVIVTHNMQQAARVSDFAAFLDLGTLVEHAATEIIFQRPAQQRTLDYVTGRFG